LADPVPDVPELDAPLLPLARLAALAGAAPGKPDVVPCEGRSSAETALADAEVRSEPLALLLLELVAAQREAPLQMWEPQLAPREPSWAD